ncbi:hypothetical protein WOLCODRAFT_20993 [Wolfiporia cocos MD-104 SS10]|uniref:Uncharacterized protein n=1 Tax=Wolfiporia cocos (strain MD-104) TaxID=742152 RepID=A0A2H3JMI5_WOLCO|nr:hypothetical protein WOLCODRAFT_20993 [Wolfiporia cocos MD-104 SS10]
MQTAHPEDITYQKGITMKTNEISPTSVHISHDFGRTDALRLQLHIGTDSSKHVQEGRKVQICHNISHNIPLVGAREQGHVCIREHPAFHQRDTCIDVSEQVHDRFECHVHVSDDIGDGTPLSDTSERIRVCIHNELVKELALPQSHICIGVCENVQHWSEVYVGQHNNVGNDPQ